MDPALIGAATSFIGGILGRNSEKKSIAAQNAYNHPSAIRARAEQAGFNPLLFVGPGVGQQTATGGSNYMGSAIAEAGLLVADGLQKRKDAMRVSQLEILNATLAEKLQNQTLRPKVGGIYAQRESVPSIRQAVGGSNVSSQTAVPVAPAVSGASSTIAGAVVPHSPDFDDTQKIEDRYGDAVSWVYGAGVALADGGRFLAPYARNFGSAVSRRWSNRDQKPPLFRGLPLKPQSAARVIGRGPNEVGGIDRYGSKASRPSGSGFGFTPHWGYGH